MFSKFCTRYEIRTPIPASDIRPDAIVVKYVPYLVAHQLLFRGCKEYTTIILPVFCNRTKPQRVQTLNVHHFTELHHGIHDRLLPRAKLHRGIFDLKKHHGCTKTDNRKDTRAFCDIFDNCIHQRNWCGFQF